MAPAAADILITNGKIHTVDDARPSAAAVAIAGGTIAWVGEGGDAREHAGPRTIEIDAAGHTVLVGVRNSDHPCDLRLRPS
jgi:hypothetical protein